MTSILATGSTRYFQFDSASRLVCADTVQGGCALNRIHYDVDGRRVLDDAPTSMKFTAFVDDSVSLDGGLINATRIEIRAFGERIAYKVSGDGFRTAGGVGAVPWEVPPAALEFLAGLAFVGLLAWLARQGALVLVIQRPGYAGVSAVLVVVLVLGPIPGARVSRAGGGGDANFYWELADRLGTSMLMLDETSARRVHRTYSPFGVEHASAGSGDWLPRHYAGHLEDEDSGLVYMQARWMDPKSGTFLSVDPMVADADDPQAFNAYAYARNNPIAYVDPDGRTPIFPQSLVKMEAAFQAGPVLIDGLYPYDPLMALTRHLERRPGEQVQRVEQLKKELFHLKLAAAAAEEIDGLPLVAGNAKELILEIVESLLLGSAEKELLDQIREKELELRALGETPDNAWFDEIGDRIVPSQEKKEQRKELEITIEPPDSHSPSGISGAIPSTGGGMTPITAPATYDYYVPWTDPFASWDGSAAFWDWF